MPVVIEEVVVDIQQPVTEPDEALPAPQQLPLDRSEAELAAALAQIQQRQQRLKVD